MPPIIPESCRIPVGLKRGATGPAVRVLQEWLGLGWNPVTVDGDFGPATERALFQAAFVREVTPGASGFLPMPMTRAVSAKGSLVEVAARHLLEHPREVGGANRGPWVRLYCDNVEGLPWCAFAARHLARQAGDPWAERISPDCDVIGRNAKADGRLSTTPTIGGLFLVRGPSAANPYTHTGIVTDIGPGWVATWEGNSNDEGGREGHEACARTRGAVKLDFVRLGA